MLSLSFSENHKNTERPKNAKTVCAKIQYSNTSNKNTCKVDQLQKKAK